MNTFLQDLRFGLRMLAKDPNFTAVAVLTLALGIGGTTAIFSVVNSVVLRPLPYAQPERLVSVLSTPLIAGVGHSASYPDFLDWRARNHVFERMAVYRSQSFTLTGAREPQHLSGAVVSADLFLLLDVDPVLGRSFLPEDDQPGAANGADAVILSYGFWQREFGSDPSVVGRSIDLNGHAYEVVGVAPPGFQFPIRAEPINLWTTVAVDFNPGGGGVATYRGAHYLDVIARLRPQVTVAVAQAEMRGLVSAMNQEHPESRPRTVGVAPLLDDLVGPARLALLILLGTVGCVLLISCANVASLLLARAATRQREMSVRVAVGASRGRVIRQVLTESTLLAFLGGLLGVLMGLWGLSVLIRFVPVDIPRLTQVELDGRVLLFTLVVAVLTGLLFGLPTALFGFKVDLAESLKECGRGPSQGSHNARTHGALIVGEIALALVLLAGASLLLRSFVSLRRVDPGFDSLHVLTLRIDSPETYSLQQQLELFDQVVTRVRSLPGVRSASGVFGLPFSEDEAKTVFDIEGRPSTKGDRLVTSYLAVAPDYFQTLGIPLLQGRDFNSRDNLEARPVTIINEAFARRFFPGEDPIGQRISPGISNGYGDKYPLREIVGVIGDVKLHSLVAVSEPQCYVPLAQSPLGVMSLVVRTDGDPLRLAPAARSVVTEADRNVPAYNITTLRQLLAQSVAQPRFMTLLLGIFAALAVVLAAVGLYGLVTYSVAQRTREIGVRMALGAERRDVLRLVIRRGFKLTLIGFAIGIAGALGLTRLLSSLLYSVKPTDPFTYVAVSLIMIGVALAACYIPARRATKVDPIEALRHE